MLYMSLIASSVGLGTLFHFMGKKDSGPVQYLTVGFFGGLLFSICCLTFLPGATISMLAGTAGAIAWHVGHLSRRAAIPILLSALLVGHLVTYWLWVAPDMRRYDEISKGLIELNPDERLQRPAKPAIESIPIADDSDGIEKRVLEIRRGRATDWRLAFFHDSQVDRFVNNAGFGVIRMSPPPLEIDFFLPSREPILQPSRIATSQSRHDIEHPIAVPTINPTQPHRKAAVEFAFPFGWGLERKPNEFLGFQSHQIGKRSKQEADSMAESAFNFDGGWRIASLELIGLLAHPKPTVYMTENLPRMDEAKTAPTRDPDEFESAGLKALAGGKELYFGQSRTEPLLRMVGGLRAAKSCTACHGCREGELLGAFSYTLVK